MRDDESVDTTENLDTQAPAVAEVAESGSAENLENQGTSTAETGETAETSTESAETSTESAEPTGPSEEEIAEALKAFEAVVAQVVETRDQATGDLAESEQGKVRQAYADIPTTAAKTKARNYLDTGMKSALGQDLDAVKARAFMELGKAVKATASARETVAKAPVDPTEAHVAKVTAMYLAANLVEVPEGVSDDWGKQVQDLASSLRGELGTYAQYLKDLKTWNGQPEESRGDAPAEPEVSDVVRNAARIARGRSLGGAKASGTRSTSARTPSATSSYNGPRRSVKAHIVEAFASKPSGTFMRVLEISNTKTSVYGDDSPSSGAVSAALFPPNGSTPTLEGVQPSIQNGVKGAVKI